MRTNKEQQQEIIFRYQNGESSEDLAQEYGISGPAVRGLLARHGIERRGRELAARKYTCNHDFFRSIDNEEKAYWLGFIAADGCIHRNEMKVSLSLKDRDHLLRLAKAISSSNPITTQTKYSSATFAIYSTELTNDLIKHGITPQKTFTLQWPTLSSKLLRHFTRGYVDGDGCFTLDSNARNNANVLFSVTSNKPFLLDMQTYLMQSCILNQTKLAQRHKNSPIYTLMYSGRYQLRRIVAFLYHDATIYLPRKYDKAYSLIL